MEPIKVGSRVRFRITGTCATTGKPLYWYGNVSAVYGRYACVDVDSKDYKGGVIHEKDSLTCELDQLESWEQFCAACDSVGRAQ